MKKLQADRRLNANHSDIFVKQENHMPNYEIFNEKDIDGRWFKFDHQQMGNSCTLASAKIAKEYSANALIGEEALRGLATLFDKNLNNQGVSPLAPEVTNAINWETTPGYRDLTLKVLKAQPLPIQSAKAVTVSADLLRQATRNHPVLIGWSWTGGGGHCTVCVGSTRANGDVVVILDPAYGLQYVDLNKQVSGKFIYKPLDKSTGIAAAMGEHRSGNTFITTT